MLKYFWTNEKEQTPLDDQIEAVLKEMSEYGPSSPEYPTLMKHLEGLYEVKAKDKPSPVSRDTVVMVLGNLAGILLIIGYERSNVMTSKAINQIIRPMK